MEQAYIGVGSNVGDRQGFCRRGVENLGLVDGISIEAVSGLYETSPVGGPPQRSFVNLVAKISTTLSARVLLHACKDIEKTLGRSPTDIRWGPRVIDLDVLLYGAEKINEPDLEVPHPRIVERRFVLVPLLELDPDAADPWGGRYSDWLDEAEGEVVALEPF
jgi:2-amino-4-hydroxy-6-hydroxymethyldihydropteridine diphosphokinase